MSEMNHTRIPNLSIGTMDSSAASTPFLNVDSTAQVSLLGSAVTVGGGAVAIGTSGSRISGIVRSTVSVALGTVAFDSITTQAALSGITVGDPVINVEKASIWSGAYNDITVDASCTSWGAVQFRAANSTLTAINTTAMNFTITWIDLA